MLAQTSRPHEPWWMAGTTARSAKNLYCCGTGSLSPGGTGGGLLKISSWAVSSSDSALARPMTGLERG
jgi:hypothetical protein